MATRAITLNRSPNFAVTLAGLKSRVVALLFLLGLLVPAFAEETPRQTIARAIVEEDDAKKVALIGSLAGKSDDAIKFLLTAWKEDAIFLYKAEGSDTKIPVTLTGNKDADDKQAAILVDDAQPLKDKAGQPLRIAASDYDSAEHDSNLRAAMKGVLDLLALAAPDREKRVEAISTLGMAQDPEKLPALLMAQKIETDRNVQKALREAIALIQLKDTDANVQVNACKELAELNSIPSQDFLKAVAAEADASGNGTVAKAARTALVSLDEHVRAVNVFGTAFRGLSTGSILLVVALGLAITFGLMGVINMAHGEVMVVGAYATYVVQNLFGSGLEFSPFGIKAIIPGLNAGGILYESYFLVALPMAFISAALVGIALERGVIRFLY